MRRIAVAMVAVLALGLGGAGALTRWTGSRGDGPVLGPAVLVVATHTPTSRPTQHPAPTVGPGTSTSVHAPQPTGHAGPAATAGANQGPVQAASANASPSVMTEPPPSPSYVDDHGGHGDSGKDGSKSGGSNSGGSYSGSGGG